MGVQAVMLGMMLFPDFVAVEDCGVYGPGVTSLYHLVTDLHPMVSRSKAQPHQHTPDSHCLKWKENKPKNIVSLKVFSKERRNHNKKPSLENRDASMIN